MATRPDGVHLRHAIALAALAREHGNHPFGALLVDGDGNVVLEAENTVISGRDVTAHAELNLVRDASGRFDEAFLRTCTLFTSTEPCAMCAGAIYWAGIGRVVFALGADTLATVAAGAEGDTGLALPSREVFARGWRTVEVAGPRLEAEGRAVHEGFWS